LKKRASKKTSLVWSIDKNDLQEIINVSSSLGEVLSALGISKGSSGSRVSLKNRIELDGLDLSKLEERRSMTYRENSRISTLEEILIENSTYSRTHMKKKLINEGLLVNECSECKCPSSWNGKELVMVLDHINGINNDNRLENLRLLCPNCNSQQDTFAGRNNRKEKKSNPSCNECGSDIDFQTKNGLCRACYSKSKRKVERPHKEVLLSQVEELGYVGTGKLYGVSDNTIRKWIKNMVK
jgi:transposase-like protein